MRVVAVMTTIAVTNTAAITPIVEPALKQLYSGVIHIAHSVVGLAMVLLVEVGPDSVHAYVRGEYT